ncbi:MAG: beta strand repeat-containing protein, partial [Bdellovibrionales bacterium]
MLCRKFDILARALATATGVAMLSACGGQPTEDVQNQPVPVFAAPSSITLLTPASSPNTANNPTVQVAGLTTGDLVGLYSDSSCSTLISAATAAGSTHDFTGFVLPEGTSNLYARRSDGTSVSSCSSATLAYTVDTTAPAAPTGLALSSPASSPGNSATPTINVTGVENAASVKLFSDASCTTQLGSATAIGSSASVSSSTLSPDGGFTFYANQTDQAGNISSCSTANVAYTLDTLAPALPSSLTLNTPASSPNTSTTPSIDIGGSEVGATVWLYSDASCATLVGSATATGGTTTVTSSALATGTYTMHARQSDPAANASACSTASVTYEVDNYAAPPILLTLSNPATTPNTDTTPTINIATVETGATVRLYTDNTCSTQVGSAVAAGANVDVTSSALSDGTYNFYASQTDVLGNVSTCSTATVQYVLNTAVPAAPNSLTLVTPATSPGNDNTPTIRVGGVVSGDTIKLFSDAACTTQVGSGSASGTTIDLTSSTLSPDGVFNVYANATNIVGTSSCSTATVAYTLDTAAPAVPSSLVLNTPATSPNTDTTPSVDVGTTESGATVGLYSDASCTTLLGTSTAAGATTTVTSSTLAGGSYTLYAKQTDPAGNASACSTANVAYVLDLTPPAAPSALTLSVPATSPDTDNTPTINVAGVENGASVALYTDASCSAQVGTATSAGTNVDVTSSTLSEGVYTFYAKQTDAAGNASTCSTANVGYEVLTTVPTVPSALSLVTPATSPGNNATPTIQVSGVANGWTVKLFSDASCTTQVASAAATGSTINLTTPTLSPDGTFNFYANSTNVAGTSACSTATIAYTLDTAAPADPTSLTLNSPATSPGNDTTPSVDIGTTETGASVTLYSDASCSTLLGTSTATGATTTVTSSVLTAGSYTFYAKQTDAAGNASGCSAANVAYTLDLTAPSAPSTLTLSNPATSPNADSTPTINVAGVENPATVRLYTDASCSTQVGSATSAGANVDVTSSVLADGTYTFYADQLDAAGNASTCSTANVGYEVLSSPPTVPSSLTLITPASSPGTSATPTIQVGGVANTWTIKLFTDAACTTQVASGTASGTTINLTSSTLSPEGTFNFYANATNVVGTSACSTATVAYTLDNTAPADPTLLTLVSPTGTPGNDTTPTVGVSTTETGASVMVFTDASCTAQVGSATAIGGTTSVTTSALTAGSYVFYAKQTDAAGNASGCSAASVNYTLDTTVPSTPTSITLVSPASSPDTDTTPTVDVGGMETNATAKLYTDASCSTQVGSAQASGSNVNVTTSVLATGSYTFYANQTDLAGNTSVCSSTSLSYQVIDSPPSAPSSLTLVSPSASPDSDSTPQIRVAGVSTGWTVALFTDAACSTQVASGTATGTTIDLTSSTLSPDGTFNFYANSTNGSGTSACSTATVAYTLNSSLIPLSAPTGLTLIDPASSPNTDSTPIVRVAGVASGDT